MKKLMIPMLALALAMAVPLAAQQQTQGQTAPKPEPKTEPAGPASVAGKWNMSIEGPQGTMAAFLDLKLEQKKVTGSLTSDMGETALEGEWADGKLTFWISMNGGGSDFSITFIGALKEDGSMVGTFDFGQGAMNWKATRAK